ncbi:MAG TPA: hypothetical protein VGQ76_23240 [Thermoanaerobaculia bacterium]|jgi:hypothetical protein|nr:hypothetical protein [Thermoanaerobaculia bacterium]
MRTRQFRALAVSVLLAFMLSTVPAMAAPRDHGGWWDRDFSFIGKVVKKLRKTFGVTTNSDGLTLPTP